ncbi:nuclease-related domain-containing protein [Heyndrickxia sp. NPDC080065]|uniref:nuclease-related domain-containing protein n=1 Tax=Heyndrickxia sp. NPDC080065 TaxID=3390568 RepID=UPI003D05337B
MVIKELTVPFRIFMDIALLRRTPSHHLKKRYIEEDLTKRKVGYRGEQTLKYYLEFIPDNDYYIFHNIRLKCGVHIFQIDTLILTPNFILIIEVKNYSGTLIFEKHSDQLIRIYQNKEEIFPNPIFQVQRHQIQLERLLKQYNLPTLPIEHIVIISNSSTQIKTSQNNLQIYEKVLHPEKIISKMEELINRYKEIKIKPHTLKKISQLLHSKHIPDIPNITKLFEIPKHEIIKGIQCPSCLNYPMIRKHGTWYCPICHDTSKDAHAQAILDYFLLIEPTITNRKCQEFILYSNRKIVTNLLSSMNLPISGNDGGRKYLRPPIQYFQDTFTPI